MQIRAGGITADKVYICMQKFAHLKNIEPKIWSKLTNPFCETIKV